MDKQFYCARIDKIAKESFNAEQKALAKKIIEKADEKDLDAVWGLVSQRVKIGFTFDEAPEVNHGAVAVVKENEKLFIKSPAKESGKSKDIIEHKLIIGENYDALKNLIVTYTDGQGKGLIDVIYIDPPYNTERSRQDGNDYKEEVKAEKFIYRDKFTRDGWLNMMNERLRLAKRLLSDKGVIFISIDDSEHAYLKVLCDEIFGEDNFNGSLPRVTKQSGKSAEAIAKNHDYILMYSKSDVEYNLEKHDDDGYCNKDEYFDERGFYKLNQTLDYDTLGYVASLDYPITINGETFYAGGNYDEHKKRLAGQHSRADWTWRWSKDLFEFGLENGFIVVKKSANGTRLYTKTYQNVTIRKPNGHYVIVKIDRTKNLSTLKFTENIYSNDNAKKDIDSILGRKAFDYPKPVALIKDLCKFGADENALVLDFFAGSGTTGQAVMELNEEDGGRRRFILVTNNENNIGVNVTRERLYRVINGEGSKGEKIEWEYGKDKKSLANNSVRVFDIYTESLTIADVEKAEKIKEAALTDFKKLNENYKVKNSLDIYTQLASLNPQKPLQ